MTPASKNVKVKLEKIRPRVRAVWSKSLLAAWKKYNKNNFASLAFQNEHNEDSDLTADQDLCWAHMSKGPLSDIAVKKCKQTM